MSMCHLNFRVEGGRVGAEQTDQSRAGEAQRRSRGAEGGAEDRETGGQGDQGDRGTGRQGDRETWRHGDRETGRQGDREPG